MGVKVCQLCQPYFDRVVDELLDVIGEGGYPCHEEDCPYDDEAYPPYCRDCYKARVLGIPMEDL
jgi:hypothetical protein